MNNHSLTLTYNPNPEALAPADGYWLTIEQVKEDEKATVAFVAETIDALFDTSLCVENPDEEPTEAVEPVDPKKFTSMEEVLAKIAAKTEVDMSACEKLRMGTYQAQLKIVRSHPDIPYTLKLSVGEILETVLTEEVVSENINIENVYSAILPFPVQSGLRCSWLGAVVGRQGFISPPTIQAIGNTLFWGVEATGVIRAEYNTIYDLVTVEIPGVPNYEGAQLGKSQDADAIAFYHYLVYRAAITPPDEEEGLLQEVCGYSSSTGIDDLDKDEPLPEPPPVDESTYGCIEYFESQHPVYDAGFYTEKCCVNGEHDGCRTRKTKKEANKRLSQEIIDEMTNEWPGPIEFIGLGPITPEGCGANYENTKVIAKNCCDVAEPIEWNTELSIETIGDNSDGYVAVTGGVAPYFWSIRGHDFSFGDRGMRDVITYDPHVVVHAGADACGFAHITVTDNCTVATGGVRSTNGQWVPMPDAQPCEVFGSGIIGWNTMAESISGEYKVRQYTESDWTSCDYGGFGNCSEQGIARAIASFCSDPIRQPACFAVSATLCSGRDDMWYELDLPNLRVKQYKFNNYALWKWEC